MSIKGNWVVKSLAGTSHFLCSADNKNIFMRISNLLTCVFMQCKIFGGFIIFFYILEKCDYEDVKNKTKVLTYKSVKSNVVDHKKPIHWNWSESQEIRITITSEFLYNSRKLLKDLQNKQLDWTFWKAIILIFFLLFGTIKFSQINWMITNVHFSAWLISSITCKNRGYTHPIKFASFNDSLLFFS